MEKDGNFSLPDIRLQQSNEAVVAAVKGAVPAGDALARVEYFVESLRLVDRVMKPALQASRFFQIALQLHRDWDYATDSEPYRAAFYRYASKDLVWDENTHEIDGEAGKKPDFCDSMWQVFQQGQTAWAKIEREANAAAEAAASAAKQSELYDQLLQAIQGLVRHANNADAMEDLEQCILGPLLTELKDPDAQERLFRQIRAVRENRSGWKRDVQGAIKRAQERMQQGEKEHALPRPQSLAEAAALCIVPRGLLSANAEHILLPHKASDYTVRVDVEGDLVKVYRYKIQTNEESGKSTIKREELWYGQHLPLPIAVLIPRKNLSRQESEEEDEGEQQQTAPVMHHVGILKRGGDPPSWSMIAVPRQMATDPKKISELANMGIQIPPGKGSGVAEWIYLCEIHQTAKPKMAVATNGWYHDRGEWSFVLGRREIFADRAEKPFWTGLDNLDDYRKAARAWRQKGDFGEYRREFLRWITDHPVLLAICGASWASIYYPFAKEFGLTELHGHAVDIAATEQGMGKSTTLRVIASLGAAPEAAAMVGVDNTQTNAERTLDTIQHLPFIAEEIQELESKRPGTIRKLIYMLSSSGNGAGRSAPNVRNIGQAVIRSVLVSASETELLALMGTDQGDAKGISDRVLPFRSPWDGEKTDERAQYTARIDTVTIQHFGHVIPQLLKSEIRQMNQGYQGPWKEQMQQDFRDWQNRLEADSRLQASLGGSLGRMVKRIAISLLTAERILRHGLDVEEDRIAPMMTAAMEAAVSQLNPKFAARTTVNQDLAYTARQVLLARRNHIRNMPRSSPRESDVEQMAGTIWPEDMADAMAATANPILGEAKPNKGYVAVYPAEMTNFVNGLIKRKNLVGKIELGNAMRQAGLILDAGKYTSDRIAGGNPTSAWRIPLSVWADPDEEEHLTRINALDGFRD